jgi:glycosyltransferase involved in cell wall biosynthesis
VEQLSVQQELKNALQDSAANITLLQHQLKEQVNEKSLEQLSVQQELKNALQDSAANITLLQHQLKEQIDENATEQLLLQNDFKEKLAALGTLQSLTNSAIEKLNNDLYLEIKGVEKLTTQLGVHVGDNLQEVLRKHDVSFKSLEALNHGIKKELNQVLLTQEMSISEGFNLVNKNIEKDQYKKEWESILTKVDLVDTKGSQIKELLVMNKDELSYLPDIIENTIQKRELLFSLVIPFYNVDSYLEKCLSSIVVDFDKTKTDSFEIILVNDFSDDKSKFIAEKYIRKYPEKFKLVNHRLNRGQSCARNIGVKYACGKFVGFLDSDDYLLEGGFQKIIDMALSSKEDQISIYGFDATKDGERIWGYLPEKNDVISSTQAVVLYSRDKFSSAVWNKIFPKKIFKNLLFEENIYYEDLAFTPLALKSVKELRLVKEKVVAYRQDGNGYTRQKTTVKHVDGTFVVLDILLNSDFTNDVKYNFFYDRWTYHLRIWQLDEQLLIDALEKVKTQIDQFVFLKMDKKECILKFLEIIEGHLNRFNSALIEKCVSNLLRDSNANEMLIGIEKDKMNKYKIVMK